MINPFDQVTSRWNTKSEKWDIIGNKEALVFTIADMDFTVAAPIMKALNERASHPILGYTMLTEGFYDAITGFVQRHHHWNLEKDWISITPGVMAGIGIAIDAWSKEGDGIIIQTPVYTPFFRVIERSNRRLLKNPLQETTEGFFIDFNHLEECMKKARIFLLCNPHNPTGRVFTREELERIANLAEKYQVLILSDEIHSDLCFQGHTHIPIDTISDYAHKHSLTMIAPSKTFNIPGLATSVAIVPNPTLRKSFENKLKALGLHEGNVFGIEALEAAYTLGDSWLAELMDYLKTNRDFALKTLTTHLPKVRCFTPEGTYLLWMDFSAYGSHQEVREKLLSHNVVLSDGLIYGEEGLGWMRMNIGCPLATLNEGLARIIKGLEE